MMMKNSKKQMKIPRGPRTQEENNQRGKHRASSSDKGIGKTKNNSTAEHNGANALKHGRHGKKKRVKILVVVLVVLLVVCAGAALIFMYYHN